MDQLLQTVGEPDGTQEVERAQAVAGVREVQQGSCFYQETDGCKKTTGTTGTTGTTAIRIKVLHLKTKEEICS